MREKGFALPLVLVIFVLGTVIVGGFVYFKSRPNPQSQVQNTQINQKPIQPNDSPDLNKSFQPQNNEQVCFSSDYNENSFAYEDLPNGWKKARNDEYKIEVSYPKSYYFYVYSPWDGSCKKYRVINIQYRKSKPNNYYDYKNTPGAIVSMDIVISKNEQTAEELFQMDFKETKQGTEPYGSLDNESSGETVIDGINGFFWFYDAPPFYVHTAQPVRKYYFSRGGLSFNVTIYGSSSGEEKDKLNIFDQILKSLKLH